MPQLADIFRRYGPEYIERFGQAMPPSHRRALGDIMGCQTPAMGGHVFVCDQCGVETFAYHSCRNRACPKCHSHQIHQWTQKRREQLLDVPYFHLVFTLPQPLRSLARASQKRVYAILMKSAAQALLELARDRHYVGATLGIMAVLHTWTSTLEYHPHVHCLVPAGGLSPDKKHWAPTRKRFLVPVKALSRLFRGKFIADLKQQAPEFRLPPHVFETDWVVYCKPAIQGPQKVLEYLARYVHRIAITNNRIITIHDGKVTFRFTSNKDHARKTMTLPALEFIRRFLQHVLPKAFHKVRDYGLWAPVNTRLLRLLRYRLASSASASTPNTHKTKENDAQQGPAHLRTSPHCPIGILRFHRRVPKKYPPPP